MSKKLFLVLALIPVLLFTGCGKKQDPEPAPGSAEASPDDTDVEDSVSQTKEPYHVPDIQTAFDWTGRPVSALGIHHSYVGGNGIRIDGELFGSHAEGEAFYAVPEEEEKVIGGITLYLNEDDLPAGNCLKQMKELYGAPTAEGEEPYAAANGGAVQWAEYDTGIGIIRYSMGSENDWYSLTYTLKEGETAPDDTGRAGDFDIPNPAQGFIAWDADGDGAEEELHFCFHDQGDEAPGYIEFTLYTNQGEQEALLDRAYGINRIFSENDGEGPYLEIRYAMGDYYSHDTESTCTLRLRDGALVLEGDNV